MSNHYAHARHAELQATLYSGLRHLLCMLLPATIFLFIFADDIIHVALQRGKFTFFDTLNTARVLRAYSVGLMGVAFFQYLQRFYYAIHKIAFTIRILAFIVIVDIALSWWLKDTRRAVSALGWANSIAFSLGALLYYLLLPYARRGSRAMRAALIWLLKVAVSVSAPTLLLFCYQFAFPLSEESAAPLLRLIAILISACGYTFFVLWLYGRFRVMHSIKDFFARRTRHGKE